MRGFHRRPRRSSALHCVRQWSTSQTARAARRPRRWSWGLRIRLARSERPSARMRPSISSRGCRLSKKLSIVHSSFHNVVPPMFESPQSTVQIQSVSVQSSKVNSADSKRQRFLESTVARVRVRVHESTLQIRNVSVLLEVRVVPRQSQHLPSRCSLLGK